MAEVILTGIHDPRWLTEEGIAESVATTRELVANALDDPGQFLGLTSYGPGMIRGESPLEQSTLEGLRAVGRSEEGMWEALEVWRHLGPYPPEVVITAAVFQEERAGIANLVEPEESFIVAGAINSELRRALTESDNPGDAIIGLEVGLDKIPSFRKFKTPKGRVEQIVGVTSRIVEDQEKLEIALQRIEERFDRERARQGIEGRAPYSIAVAAGLRELLSL